MLVKYLWNWHLTELCIGWPATWTSWTSWFDWRKDHRTDWSIRLWLISPTYLRAAFTPVAPKSIRIQSSCQYLFTLLGFTGAKAANRTLMKLTIDYYRISQRIQQTQSGSRYIKHFIYLGRVDPFLNREIENLCELCWAISKFVFGSSWLSIERFLYPHPSPLRKCNIFLYSVSNRKLKCTLKGTKSQNAH